MTVTVAMEDALFRIEDNNTVRFALHCIGKCITLDERRWGRSPCKVNAQTGPSREFVPRCGESL